MKAKIDPKTGRFTPSWWGEEKKVNRGTVSIRGGYWRGSESFSCLSLAAASAKLFNSIQKNIIS